MDDLIKRFGSVQLATLVEAPPPGDQWLHEIKFDGYRLLGFLDGKEVKLFTRNGNDWTDRFPSIRAAMARVKARTAVLDMEAVIVEAAGRTSFHALQEALGTGGNGAAIIAYVFDVLHLDGEDLREKLQVERKQRLKELLGKSRTAEVLHYSEHVIGKGAEMLAQACTHGLEGIVSKRGDAPYRTGRQRTWLKSKCVKRQEFIIVGFSTAKSGSRAIGALYLGYKKDGRVTYAGKVGTGYTMDDAVGIYQKLLPMEQKAPTAAGLPRSEARFIHWVRPELLCEVAFTEWPENGHVRHPSFQGLREDKAARGVRRERARTVDGEKPA